MPSTTRDDLMRLIEKKNQIESKLRDLQRILIDNNIGMTEPLVDEQGYPLAHIDVYQVRHARHEIICLQNDFKDIMREIERGLHQMHTSANASDSRDAAMEEDKDEEVARNSSSLIHTQSVFNSNKTIPFARVNRVDEGSPAQLDGIRVDDLIVEFGSLNVNNFKDLGDFAQVVQRATKEWGIPTKILRNGAFECRMVLPRPWAGRGLLGCNIVPLESIER